MQTLGQRLVARTVMAAAFVCGAGSLVLFAAQPSAVRVKMGWPDSIALPWDALLSFAFFVQHSGMVRPGFRARLTAVVPPAYHRAVYSIASGVVLTAAVVLWQQSPHHVLVLDDAYRWVARAGALAAMAVFAWGAIAAREIDLFGLGAIRARVRQTPARKPVFVVRGPYRWVRHPWYSAVIVLIWSVTDLTADRLLFNVLWTAWICVGARLEEADLAAEFGDAYTRYRREVPMLVPWRGPADAIG